MQIDDILACFKGVRRSGQCWSAACPAHKDRNNSLSIGVGDKGIVLKCHTGCSAEAVVKAIGIEFRELFFDDNIKVASTPRGKRARVHTPLADDDSKNSTETSGSAVASTGITLEAYAKAKDLPIEFLKSLGLRDQKRSRRSAIAIPYYATDGREHAMRYRTAGTGKNRFSWRKGSKLQPYGLERLEEAKKAGKVVIVEGESDCHTAWHHGIPAVGVPGAGNWRDNRDAQHLDGIDTIYIVIEPDNGGEAVLNWLSNSMIKDRAHLIRLGEYKDLSELHLKAKNRFDDIWLKALADAEPFSEIEAKNAEEERQRAFEVCGGLLEEPDILSKFDEAISAAGIVGETKTARLLYLALTSRFFERPISVVVKGPSSAGKSYISERVLGFFPEDAFYALTAMSDRALAYSDEPLEHRFIVIFEAAGLESDFATYLLRSLLSEGIVRYETVEKTSEGMKPRLIERQGPTGCLITTTAPRLHPENETRMLSITISDSSEQTRIILDRLAEEAETTVDLAPWQALQTWLKRANHRITIPYGKKLVALVPESAVRLRRDIHHVLTLIKAHALLHQATREEDGQNRVTATLEDYAAIYDLIAHIIAEGVEVTVPLETRQTVEAVKSIIADGADTVSVKEVAAELGLDASSTSRRVAVARRLGYLKNEEPKRGSPAKLVIGDKLPEDVEVLPHPDHLEERVHACTCDRGDKEDIYSPEPMIEELI